MTKEIEKRFLLDEKAFNEYTLNNNLKLLHVSTSDTILIKFADNCFTRFRRLNKTTIDGKKNTYCMVCTKVGDGLVRDEYETLIPNNAFNEISKLYKKSISITFYIFKLTEDKLLEIKELANPFTHEKIYLAEIEFDSVTEANCFKPSKFDGIFKEDVTLDSSYNLINLAERFDLINHPMYEE